MNTPQPSDPITNTNPDMSPQEMVKDLTTLKNSLDEKMRDIHGKMQDSTSQLQEIQNKAIESLFQTLQDNGVNLEDQNSVNQFLMKLKEVNPQGYVMFETAIGSLLGQKKDLVAMQPPSGFAEPLNAMDKLGVEPQSPGGPANDVGEIPTGPVNPGSAQATPEAGPVSPPPSGNIPG